MAHDHELDSWPKSTFNALVSVKSIFYDYFRVISSDFCHEHSGGARVSSVWGGHITDDQHSAKIWNAENENSNSSTKIISGL